MWRGYEAALWPRSCISIDLPGYGDASSRADDAYRLGDAVRAIRPALSGNAPVDVVAHSFGGAIALRLALENPSLVRTLTLIEPSYFTVLRDMGGKALEALCAIERIQDGFSASGDTRLAMARFVDFWNGRGAWAALGRDRQDILTSKSDQVRRDFGAIFGERIHLSAFRKLVTPTLIVTGTRSPAPSLLVAQGLTRAAARASSISVPGAGHMLPITHAPDLIRILSSRLMVGAPPDRKAA
jgi:pimeloyl-ACP methyl ester carboxylesterase